MEKKNNGLLVGILIGLVIAVIVIGGLYVMGNISFKISTLSGDIKKTNTSDNIENSDITENIDNIAKKLGEKMYLNLYSFKTAYLFCGENMIWNNDEDYISNPNFGEYYHVYDVSQDFKSINELNEYLKTYMTDDMIKKYYQTDSGVYEYKDGKYVNELYVEKDRKLYCKNFNKDHGFIDYDKENSSYNVITSTENYAIVSATIGYKTKGEATTANIDKLQYEIIKNNNNWVIKSFLNIPEGMINLRAVESYLKEIVLYNDSNIENKIVVTYNGKDYSDSKGILSIVNNLDSWKVSPNGESWNVFNAIYNQDGYISKLIIS